ncbi:P-loop containing nucleoside triphosphate hydrolase protein [Dichotomocladium elegans]|nr:P-loop containing nucleoside triphosphate hydrolase protein [Dichotomocladium elegans]
MSLWVDKHRPSTFDELTYHKDISKQLKGLAEKNNVPHLLFYGPTGAGKKTRIAAMLRELYGPGAEKLKVDQRQFVTTSNRKLAFAMVTSNYHLEINPSDLGVHDRVIIQDLVKTAAQTQLLDPNVKHHFKVVVIDQADELTREAQAALRRTMEKYTAGLRLILCCNNLSKLIPPLRSRCLIIRVPRPSTAEVVHGLEKIAHLEKVALPRSLAENIAKQTQNNMRSACLALESTCVKHPDLTIVQVPELVDWQIVIQRVAKMILEEQTPSKLFATRTHLYELITRGIDPTVIIKGITFELLTKMDSKMQRIIVEKAAYHEQRMTIGRKKIFHLEAFVASVMDEYLRYRTSLPPLRM